MGRLSDHTLFLGSHVFGQRREPKRQETLPEAAELTPNRSGADVYDDSCGVGPSLWARKFCCRTLRDSNAFEDKTCTMR